MKRAEDWKTEDFLKYIKKYNEDWSVEDSKTFDDLSRSLRKHGYVTGTNQLYRIARWKTPRVSRIVKENPGKMVRKITSFVLNEIDDERFKISILTTLKGIGIPRASVILTFHNPKKYGVIDWRAWKALTGRRKMNFSVEDLLEYLSRIRALSKKHNLPCREIDKALWYYGGA